MAKLYDIDIEVFKQVITDAFKHAKNCTPTLQFPSDCRRRINLNVLAGVFTW
jgi:hypothetical protein